MVLLGWWIPLPPSALLESWLGWRQAAWAARPLAQHRRPLHPRRIATVNHLVALEVSCGGISSCHEAR